MVELLPVLQGYCTIQLWRKIGGVNWYPYTIVWEVCGNTLVSETSFHNFHGFEMRVDGSQVFQGDRSPVYKFRWLMRWKNSAQSYYVCRNVVDVKGRSALVYLAREILGLTVGSGVEVDHKNHDTLDNSSENLREATVTQSRYNTTYHSQSKSRFKGIDTLRNGYRATIRCNNGIRICFPVLVKEIEAGLMYEEAARIIQGRFRYPTVFPIDEMPTEERQKWLRDLVSKILIEKGAFLPSQVI